MEEPIKLRRDQYFRRHGSDALLPLFPNADLGVGITRTRQDTTTRLHTHEFSEIAIVEHGQGTQCYGDGAFDISVGDVFVIHPDREHSLRNTRELDLINVLFVDDGSIPLLKDLSTRSGYRAMFGLEPLLRSKDDPQRRLTLNANQSKTAISIVDRLESALYGNASESTTASAIHFLELITYLCECYETTSVKSGRILTGLGNAVSHIDANFDREIMVEDLAKAANMSLRTFQRHFQEIFETTPTRYVLNRRLSEARKLLEAGEESVTEVAFQAGFNDSAYFTRAFTKAVGTSPKRYQSYHRRA